MEEQADTLSLQTNTEYAARLKVQVNRNGMLEELHKKDAEQLAASELAHKVRVVSSWPSSRLTCLFRTL